MTQRTHGKRYYGTSGFKFEEDRKDLEEMINCSFEIFATTVISDFVPYLSFVTKLQGHASHLAKISDLAAKVADKLFDPEGHRQRIKERRDDASNAPTFGDILVEAPFNDGVPISEKNIQKIMQEMLNGGTETNTTTVEWAMAELVTRPDIIKRAQNELDAVVRTKRLVEEPDLPHLPFLQALVKECFRVHPPLPLLVPHLSHQPAEVSGYHFPAGTLLIVNTFAIHRDPSVYKNPGKFDPDRFLAHPKINQLSGYDSYELIPFGAGSRMCPAYNLGNTIVSLILANLLYTFDWSLPEDQSTVDMSECNRLSVILKKDLYLIAKPRIELDYDLAK